MYEMLSKFQDRDALMKLLTFKAVEETVKKRVEKKARTFAEVLTAQKVMESTRLIHHWFLASMTNG